MHQANGMESRLGPGIQKKITKQEAHMGLRDTLSTLAQLPDLAALKKELQPRSAEEKDCVARQVERNAEQFGDRLAILFEGRSVTWAEFNALANRYAHCLKARGVHRGEVVSLLMENRIEFLAAVTALNKLGAVAALINTNLRGRPLAHCINTTDSRACIFGEELTAALAAVKGELPLQEGSDYLFVPDSDAAAVPNWATDLAAASTVAPPDNLPETLKVKLGDTLTYLFTSGTTGLPKASVCSNRRFLAAAAMSHRAGLKCSERDRLYLCLPLYHGTGMIVGAGTAFSSGASMFLRRKFSASNFLSEVREHRTNCFVYIGELCRYLANTPAQPHDHDNPLSNIIGNGLRPDVWMGFKKRFGIRRICEFYGSSEGNVSFANLLNKDRTVGMAALVLEAGADSLDLEDFSAYVNRELPAYARPVFLRLQAGLDVTGTYKMVKGNLRKEGYDPAIVSDPLYVMKPSRKFYEPLDADFTARINAGAAGY